MSKQPAVLDTRNHPPPHTDHDIVLIAIMNINKNMIKHFGTKRIAFCEQFESLRLFNQPFF